MKKYLLSLICLLTLGCIPAAAAEKTVALVASGASYSGTAEKTEVSEVPSSIEGVCSLNISSYNSTSKEFRSNANATLSITPSAGIIIKKVVFTNTNSGSPVVSLESSDGTLSESSDTSKKTYTWEGNTTSDIQIKNTVQLRIKYFEITYDDGAQDGAWAKPVAKIGENVLVNGYQAFTGDLLTFTYTPGSNVIYTLKGGDIDVSENYYTDPISLNKVGEYVLSARTSGEGNDDSDGINLTFTVVEKPNILEDIIKRTNTFNGSGYGTAESNVVSYTSQDTEVEYGLVGANNSSFFQINDPSKSGFFVKANPKGYTIKSVNIKVDGTSNASAVVNVYGSNIPYTKAASTPIGTSIGTLTTANETEKEFDFIGNYTYFYINANTKATYISEIKVIYNTPTSGGDITTCEAPLFLFNGTPVDGTINASAGETITLFSATADSKIMITSKINDGEATSIESNEFTIPSDVNAGDLITLNAKAYVEIDNNGEVKKIESEESILAINIILKKGTKENPYTCAEVIAGDNKLGTGIWVRGYIVGYMDGSVTPNVFVASAGNINSNIVLSDVKEGHADNDAINTNSTIAVALPTSGSVRTNLNLVDHPWLIGAEVLVCGENTAYFSGKGIKNTNAYELLSYTLPAAVHPAVHESSEVKIAGGKISNAGVLKFDVAAGLKLFYKLTSKPADVNEEPGDRDFAAMDAATTADNHDHEGFSEYDHAAGIVITDNHTQLEYFVCNSEDHSDVATVAVAIDNTETGVATIEAEEGEAVYFNLQGVRVDATQPGIYIRRQGGKTTKVIKN